MGPETRDKTDNVVVLRPRKDTPAGGLGAAKERMENGRLFQFPPKLICKEEAISELEKMLGCEARTTNLAFLFTSNVLYFSRFPGGIEFHDTSSFRQDVRADGETIHDVARWVRHWYFAVIESGAMIMGRYISKEPQPGIRCSALDQPVRDPQARIGKYTLESFIETVIHGDPPD